jgi:phosphatidylglycerophosphate synthase
VPEEAAAAPSFDGVIAIADGADEVVGGLRLLERAAFTLARGGARRILCVGPRLPDPLRLPEIPITWHDAAGTPEWLRDAAPTILVTDATTVTDPASVAALAIAAGPRPLAAPRPLRLWRADPATLMARFQTEISPSALETPESLPSWIPPTGALLCAARDPVSRQAAEQALYARLGRAGDGWFTRVVDRRLSRLLTRLLLPTGISPNQVTVASMAIGIAGGWCFAQGTAGMAMAGAFLFLASTIADGCDGEIARLTFRESPFGARLDILGDNLVHLFLFGGIALGLFRRSADPAIAALGVALVVGVLGAMATVYLCVVRHPPNPSQLTLFEAFASREFAYLLVALTLAGRLDWFLWLSAIGTYAFAIGLVLLGRRQPGS